MNKAELKKFAVEARRDLIEKVSLKAEQYGITKGNQTLQFEEKYGELIVNGRTYPINLKSALKTMESKLRKVGYEQLIEEVAYTWFNRVTAIRYMEVNGHLPERVNVLSSTTGKSEPDIIFNYETMELDISKDEIRSLLSEEKTERAYRTLFVAQCNALNKVMPFLFEQIEDYTELLLPDYLLDKQSIIRKITEEVSEENFYELEENGSKKDNVEILGWLYQYYMSEKKEKVGGLKNNAVKKEDLPVVTQLFTPKWIVKYMVQNSLGKLYDEKYENNNLSKHWEYYLKHEENHHLYPEFNSLEELKIMDPACGSGHILLYAFDMLYDMYQEAGYPSRDIPQLILENNLYGLDIDKRSQQIANFALLMKAVEKQPRLLSRMNRKKEALKINIYEIVDTDQSLTEEAINYLAKDSKENRKIKEIMRSFENGKQFGSLIIPPKAPYRKLINNLKSLSTNSQDLLDEVYLSEIKNKLLPLLLQSWLLFEKYDVVVSNPPYHNKYNVSLKNFVNEYYKNYKTDLYSAFIYRVNNLNKERGYSSLMTPYTWMVLSSFQNLRNYILEKTSISSLVQLEYSAFKEATVPICSFVLQKQDVNMIGEYIKLSDFKGASQQPIKLREAVENKHVKYRYSKNSKDFKVVPGHPVAFWATENIIEAFTKGYLKEVATAKQGLATGNNAKFLRLWFEVEFKKIGYGLSANEASNNFEKKWFPLNKGGAYRKWYGNQEYVVNWKENGKEIKNYVIDRYPYLKGKYSFVVKNEKFYFKEGITWSDITSGSFSARYSPKGFLFGTVGLMLFSEKDLHYILGYINSKVFSLFGKVTMSTMHFNSSEVSQQPYLEGEEKEKIAWYVDQNIKIAKKDWDSFETSWNFSNHPLLNNIIENDLISSSFYSWERETKKRINQMKNNEELINEYFIDLFNLHNELDNKVNVSEVTLAYADKKRETKSFLSYFIGCIVGRYSLDVEGLVYAGGELNERSYTSFKPNKKGLVQFTENRYFADDIIVRLKEFLSVAFSEDTVDENIKWLAESLTMRKNESPEERLRRYFMDEFFKDHCKTYQKRPIYWLVDSGKQKGLRTLIYMHRYQPDTMATIRFEHLQEIQSKYQNEIEMLEIRLSTPDISASDRRNLEKSKESYQKKIEELQEFDKKLAVYANDPIDIDLDDGVKVNYAKFDDVLAKIK
ncbi:BREX-1 system adenine-specific DNA-methyltransferase PglX [Salinicoccus roseus]|uniref:BREX-1 system adenine-specific DNA-methyltransferase PglX n=1 Tax=Salinicoccus roseus TaxID=45670 RepID=UPI002301A6CE|nr:BREX-1 system adenine-specific DNA-methyltransferase PglX [Salinicoccus roseus]